MATRTRRDDKGVAGNGREFVQLVVDYAKQETLGPAKGLARFAAFGVAGSTMLAAGMVVLALAVLRALQEETGTNFAGNLSWLPYLITGAVATVVVGLAVWRIPKGQARRLSQQRSEGAPR